MKAKTLMGMIACAGACVSLSAFGNNTNNWFNAGVADSNITLSGVSTNGVAVQVSDGKIVLDNEKESALTFTPVETNMSTGVSVIRATAELTPSDATSLDTSLSGAKVGFAVGVAGNATNYYGFASGEWFKLDGVNPPDSGNTEFQLILDYRSATAQFFVENTGSYQILSTNNGTTTTFAFAKGDANDISGIDAYGSGSITSLEGKFELAVVDVNGTKYGSVADAEAAGGNASTIKVVDSTGAVVAKTTADNGLSAAVCAALGLPLDDSSANITVKPAATDTNQNRITLALNMPDAPETDAVEFQVSDGGSYSETCGASQIEIPLTAGTYTITPVLK
ncbi:MAG: hypothetical protein IJQ54_05660 [Kiritimatiellae bacterium]|nr:hypothetical protein [Kiritimatiellia bacterium]MBR0241998.1 hypothetical protein [Kiritimatiellia bacterium]